MSKRSAAFYIGTLAMVVMLLIVSLTVLRVFGAARADSRRAELLTKSVVLAENAAEAFSASDSPETLCGLLGGELAQTDGGYSVSVRYDEDMNAQSDGTIVLCVEWQQEGLLASGTVTVSSGGEILYTLETAVYTGGTAS